MVYFTTFLLFLVNILLFGAAAFFCHEGNTAWGWFLGVGVFSLLMTLGHIGSVTKNTPK
jgi:hypothetical protein